MPDFPGDRATGLLGEDAKSEERFAALPEEEPCPALDPETGTCDLYAARPVTCRIFGPPVRWGADAIGVCELCFQGASDREIADCEVCLDVEDLEAELLREQERLSGARGQTIVAFALVNGPAQPPPST
jgi:Fe-S-cluster containining protein